MDPAKSSHLYAFAALCAGVAIGALSTWALSSEPRSAPVGLPDAVERDVSRTAADVKSLREQVAQLERRLDEARIQWEQSSSASAARREPVPSSAEESRERSSTNPVVSSSTGAATHDSQWVSVLDQDVARCLVEHGLTPYDPGVADPVREAGDALRAESRTFNDAWMSLLKQGGPGVQESQEAMNAQHQKKRREIVDRLGAALDALRK